MAAGCRLADWTPSPVNWWRVLTDVIAIRSVYNFGEAYREQMVIHRHTMPDYKLTKVYKIICDCDDRIYVGYTTRTLDARMSSHKKATTRVPFSDHMREVGFKHFTIVLLEEKECKNAEEARQLEHKWMVELGALDPETGFNRTPPTQQLTDYEYQKQYREANKDVIRERKRKYVEENAEHVAAKKAEWGKANRAKINERRAANREKIRAQKRAAYHRAKEADPEGVAAKQRAAYERRVANDPDAVRAEGRAAYCRRKAKVLSEADEQV